MKFYDWHDQEYELPEGRTFSWRPATHAIIQDKGKILFIKAKQHRLWELPGGGIEIGELVLDALKREVFEETGYHISVKRETPVHTEDNFFYAPDINEYFHTLEMVYLAELADSRQETSHIDYKNEIVDIAWMIPDEIEKNNITLRSKRALARLDDL